LRRAGTSPRSVGESAVLRAHVTPVRSRRRCAPPRGTSSPVSCAQARTSLRWYVIAAPILAVPSVARAGQAPSSIKARRSYRWLVESPMSDGGRLELDDRGFVADGSGLPSTAVDLDVLGGSIAVTARDFGAGSWVRCHRRPLAAFLLIAAFGGIRWTTHAAPPTSPQPTVADASVAALGASQQFADPVGSRRATDQLRAAMTVFRDPSTGSLVMAYSPTR
jgi:hypothetical protein